MSNLALPDMPSGGNRQVVFNFPLFRYADVLMMKAECLLRQGKADDDATIVTQVRARNFKSTPAKTTVTGADLQKGSTYDYGLRNHRHPRPMPDYQHLIGQLP